MQPARSRLIRTMAAAGLVATVLAGCSSAPSVEVSETLEILGTDELTFVPASHAIAADSIVTLTLRSEPAVEHDLVVEGVAAFGVSEPTEGHSHDDGGGDDLHLAHAEAGGSAGALFLIEEPGTYTVFCSIPGHRDAGMEGTLEVVG